MLRYAGYCYDDFSELYYCSQRYYDPSTAQFISKDPAKADGEESAYQYCGGDPVGKVDPSGLWARELIYGSGSSHGFKVAVIDWRFTGKSYCLAFARDLIRELGRGSLKYKKMKAKRIAVEVYGHALGFQAGRGLSWSRAKEVKRVAGFLISRSYEAYVNNDERAWRVAAFYSVWHAT